MANTHLVQNTHWDHEWYFTAEDARLLSDQVFTEAIEELKRNPRAHFCLDGQSSIVDEYVELNPERAQDIKDLMAAGRLDVGPWYTQTDALLVGPESIMRNMMVGVHDIRTKYGEPMMLGYLPDTFGFNAQIPSILNACGIDTFIGWRGIDYENQAGAPYFVWKSLGDHAVYAANMPHGYSMGVMPVDALERIDEYVKVKLDPEVAFVHDVAGDEEILMPSGMDQKNMIIDYDKVVDEYNRTSENTCIHSTFGTFMDVLRKRGGLPEYRGEMREPVYARVHRTIGSVRTQMKQADTALEQKLLRRVEPLMVLAESCGIRISNGALLRAWKKLLENQAHDSMGGCVSDNVAEDIFHRLKEANEIVEGIENLVVKRLADDMGLAPNEVLLINTDPKPFSGEKTVHVVAASKNLTFEGSDHAVLESERYYPARQNVMMWGPMGLECTEEPPYFELDVRLHVEIPAFGYRVISFTEGEGALEEYVEESSASISNDAYTVSFEEGHVKLTCAGGRVIEDFLALTDMGNDGDTYDFSPIAGEPERVLSFDSAMVRRATGRSELVLSGSAELPCDLADRMVEDGKTAEVAYTVALSLGESETIEGQIWIDNTVLSHRMRLKVRTGVDSDASIAQIQGGFLAHTRVVAPETWADRYVEKPSPLEIFDKSASAETTDGYLTVFADGIKEYEKDGDALLITLMGTTGQLGKPDLAWRPGRASGDTTFAGHIMMETPLAQEVGEHVVTFGIAIAGGAFDEERVAKLAEERLVPTVSYQRQNLNLFINRLDNKIWPQQFPVERPRELSLLDLGEDCIVSAIMPSLYDKRSFVVRLVNPTAKEATVPAYLLEHAERVNALEDAVEAGETIEAYGFATFKLPIA
ncbi:alpha-mannosidase [Enorma phocaeensis]|uniref:glycoside hydrolase family 38 N-terminal domain-containing protein n=1 Tax=Enorma phocaeensis TaxID=1871019 RepID=UPI00195ECE45|nr:alpha-mannosidase [Enorma phocaeensis]MBM6953216.1 alpha-mannosidase [Enorma phocaeensis]